MSGWIQAAMQQNTIPIAVNGFLLNLENLTNINFTFIFSVS